MNDGAMRAARRIMDGLDWRCLDGGRKIARDRIVIGVEELAELIREEYSLEERSRHEALKGAFRDRVTECVKVEAIIIDDEEAHDDD